MKNSVWVDVKKNYSWPKCGSRFLVRWKDGGILLAHNEECDEYYVHPIGYCSDQGASSKKELLEYITHWCPIPEYEIDFVKTKCNE